MPTSWSVYHPANSTTDEGTWILDQSNEGNAVESGYFSGYWPYNTTYWTNGLVAYTTKGNGVYNGYYGKHGGYLTAGQGIDIDALANGRADIGSYTLTWSGYSVPNGFNVGTNQNMDL